MTKLTQVTTEELYQHFKLIGLITMISEFKTQQRHLFRNNITPPIKLIQQQ